MKYKPQMINNRGKIELTEKKLGIDNTENFGLESILGLSCLSPKHYLPFIMGKAPFQELWSFKDI